ncbi:MAG TPA: menaquinone biosynthesis protein, partial [Phycisphaerae bacterium]|nr:menaquinone biosynthesis protein [Phycisphaerae bacterium]
GVHLGVVSFLNTKPLIEGLADEPGIRLHPAVPSRLAAMLRAGETDAALVPVVDYARAAPAWQILSDACIASDGETLTVRVFSRVPPRDVRCLHVDGDSHTSVVLARLIWSRWFGRPIRVQPLREADLPGGCEAVLLIGDKVIARHPQGFAHDLDLGATWKEWTGLPFVFAVWVARSGEDRSGLARSLSAARDRGVAGAQRLAREHGPARGWPVEVAEAYLTRHMRYVLTPEALRGMRQFIAMARETGLLADAGDRVTT